MPQVYINGEFIGGCDIMMNLHQEKELSDIFEKSGAEKK
jgi:monothiol glutaredoxin